MESFHLLTLFGGMVSQSINKAAKGKIIMKKKLLATLAIGTFIFGMNGVSKATSLTMNSGLITDYDTRYEFESYGAGGNVTITGGPYGTSTDGEAAWIYADNVLTTTNNYLTVLSEQDIYTQFWQSDGNDGIAQFETQLLGSSTWVEHGTLPTYQGGNQYALLAGLTAGNYSLRITSFDQGNDSWDDLHLGHYGTTSSVPEPTAMLLFSTGLVGMIGTRIRRKKKKN